MNQLSKAVNVEMHVAPKGKELCGFRATEVTS